MPFVARCAVCHPGLQARNPGPGCHRDLRQINIAAKQFDDRHFQPEENTMVKLEQQDFQQLVALLQGQDLMQDDRFKRAVDLLLSVVT